MELKLAAMDLESKEGKPLTQIKNEVKSGIKNQKIIVEDLIKELESTEGMRVLYFDKSCKDKDLKKAKSLIEAKGKSVYMGEVRYGLDSADMIYEFRIV